MTSTQTASFAPQIVRISASSPREAHEAHEAQNNANNANNANNSELSDVDGDSDFDYDGSDDDRSPARHGHIRVPPQLSWATAAEDASNGIQYIKERFPGDNIPYLPTPFRQEPIKVEPDDKVVVLDEVTEHAVRVRLVKTGEVGIIPNWTVEDPLEKLARQNMLWNEIATSPAVEEPTTINTIRLPARRRYSPDEDADMDEELDSDWPLTPTSPNTSFMPSSSNTRRPLLIPSKPSTSHSTSKTPSSSSTLRLKRKVEFSSSPRKMIFRYFAPHDPESQWDSDSDSGSEASAQRSEESRDNGGDAREEQEGDSNWWWDGWEEAHEDDEEDDDHEHSDAREGPFDIDRERERWREGQRRRTFIVA